MKKLMLSSFSLMLSSLFMQAQNPQNLQIQVTDLIGDPAHGNLVLYYGNTQVANPATFDYSRHVNWSYADTNGRVNFPLGNLQPNDTVVWAHFDCQRLPSLYWTTVAQAGNLQRDSILCRSLPCDAMVNLQQDPALGSAVVLLEKIALRESWSTSIPGPAPAQPIFRYRNSGSNNPGSWVTRNLNNLDYDTIHLPLDTSLTNGLLEYSYNRNGGNPGANCPSIYDTISYQDLGISGGSNPSPLNCSAGFVVDTVNSSLFQGQLIVFENASSNGVINSWTWDFGDGNSSNQRYPSHQYSQNGVYNVCLSITAVDSTNPAGASCTSSYCDSIGFDANGNLVFKGQSGFTLNILDPATVNLEEMVLAQSLQMYPNPSAGQVNLTWDQALAVEELELLSLTGRILQQHRPESAEQQISHLTPGLYLVRVKTAAASEVRRLLVN